MKIPFEAKYINIEWEKGYRTASKIYEARDNIDIENCDDNTFGLEAITYKNIEKDKSGQLAFHILDTTIKNDLFFIDAQNKKVKLLRVIDDATDKIWWVEDGKDKHLIRTVGEIKIIFGIYTCIVHMRALSFTYEQLDLYLKDFRKDLWGLIQKDDSYILGKAKSRETKIAKKELTSKINKFVNYAELILKNPKKELTREYTQQKASQVRPVPKTFIDLASKGFSSMYLTGQGYKESFNVAENRYVFALVKKLLLLVGNEIATANKKLNELDGELIYLTDKITSISDIIDSGSIKINEIDIDHEIESIQKRENRVLSEALKSQGKVYSNRLKTNFVSLDGYINDENELRFFGKIKENQEDKWFQLTKGKSLQFIFDKSMFNSILKIDHEYKVEASYSTVNERTIKRNFEYIQEIKLLNNRQIRRLLAAKKNLAKDLWTRRLNQNEKNEFKFELKSLHKNKSSLQDTISEIKKLKDLLLASLSKLKRLKLIFEKYKIVSRYHFTGSMTFIQNPNYQGCHKIYKQIMNKLGLNDDLVESLEEVEKIGILDIPKVYERWCLLQIIKILMDKFYFQAEKNWKDILVKGILAKNPQNIIIKFENKATRRDITLTYEKKLKSHKRPDYVLDCKDRHGLNNRFVLDAKFWEELEISGIINELYNIKNYSEDGKNWVYVLHPDISKKSFYGEKTLFEWSNQSPNHRYGAVVLSPIEKKDSHMGDLQKLIGMFLQYGIEDNQNIKDDEGKINPIREEEVFCIVCGSNNQYIDKKKAGRENYKYWITCCDCYHMTIYSYCRKCKSRLIKNGTYWTYHAVDILEPINIECPSCGDKF